MHANKASRIDFRVFYALTGLYRGYINKTFHLVAINAQTWQHHFISGLHQQFPESPQTIQYRYDELPTQRRGSVSPTAIGCTHSVCAPPRTRRQLPMCRHATTAPAALELGRACWHPRYTATHRLAGQVSCAALSASVRRHPPPGSARS